MIRLVAVIFGLILGWLGFLSTAEAAIAVPTQSYVQAYEYDGHRMPVQVVDANSERGPPAACDYATNHDAVGHRSRGDSVRPSGTTPRAAFAYDQQAPLAQAVSAATPTAGPGRAASGDARARLGASVAAKSERAFTRFTVNSAGKATMHLRVGAGSLEVTEDAAQRMTQRGISIDAAESTLQQQPFQYFHADVWKTGYYDPASRLFLGAVDGRVTTVIGNATPKYIANLQAAVP